MENIEQEILDFRNILLYYKNLDLEFTDQSFEQLLETICFEIDDDQNTVIRGIEISEDCKKIMINGDKCIQYVNLAACNLQVKKNVEKKYINGGK